VQNTVTGRRPARVRGRRPVTVARGDPSRACATREDGDGTLPLTLNELAERIGAEPVGDPALVIHSAHTLEEAGPGQVSFLANPKYLKQIETTRAAAVIVAPTIASGRTALLRAKDPYFAFRQAVVALHGFRRHPHDGVHPKAHVDPTATVGAGSVLYPGVYLGPRAVVGRDCILYPNVVVYDDCVLGDRVTVHAGSSIGQDGFGYATHRGEHHKIPQVGNVVIEDDVEIGANCSIERAALGSTVIGRGTKFSDNVTIGHGTKIGPHGLLVAQVGIAGSTTIGRHLVMAGQSGIAGHLKIGDRVTVAAQSGVISDAPDGAVLMGMPALPAGRARRASVVYAQLPELLERVRKLERGAGQTGPAGAGELGPAAPGA
jgi:UDP-3-O-[3-hydroxymyristoyl] glucosamine N-acyltransferase